MKILTKAQNKQIKVVVNRSFQFKTEGQDVVSLLYAEAVKHGFKGTKEDYSKVLSGSTNILSQVDW